MSFLGKSDVFVDLCTQRDYLCPDGSRPCVNADQVLRSLRRLMACVRWEKLPLISCIDARRPDEVRGISNPACVMGTRGQQKPSFTLMPHRAVIESDNCLSVPLDFLEHVQQAVLIKRHRDPFTNPKLDRLLTEMPARRFIVFGLPVESSLRLLVLGLLLRGRSVAVALDTCGWWNQNEADMAIRQVLAKGCEAITVESYIQAALARRKPASDPNKRRSVA